MTGLRIALLVAVMIFIGLIGNQLNIGVKEIVPITKLLEPSGNGIWDAIKTALAPLIWAFNGIASFLQIMTWQADIPALAKGLFSAVGFYMAYVLLRLVRGGG